DQRGERSGGEVNLIAALAGDGKGRPELPSGGEFEASGVADVVRLPALGIKQNLVPTDHSQLVGGRRAGGETAFKRSRRQEVELHVDFRDTRGDFNVNREAVEQVAAPFQSVAGGGELQAGQIDHGAVGGVLSGDPFRVVER